MAMKGHGDACIAAHGSDLKAQSQELPIFHLQNQS